MSNYTNKLPYTQVECPACQGQGIQFDGVKFSRIRCALCNSTGHCTADTADRYVEDEEFSMSIDEQSWSYQ